MVRSDGDNSRKGTNKGSFLMALYSCFQMYYVENGIQCRCWCKWQGNYHALRKRNYHAKGNWSKSTSLYLFTLAWLFFLNAASFQKSVGLVYRPAFSLFCHMMCGFSSNTSVLWLNTWLLMFWFIYTHDLRVGTKKRLHGMDTIWSSHRVRYRGSQSMGRSGHFT